MNIRLLPRGAGISNFEIQHVHLTGQSNSFGAYGNPVLSTTQPYNNKMFAGGVRQTDSGLTSLVDLIENTSGAYGETAMSGMLNFIAGRYPNFIGMASQWGFDGGAYTTIKKGTVPYSYGTSQTTAAKALAAALGKRYKVGAICVLHGEADATNTSYLADLIEFQQNLSADHSAISGQAIQIPLIIMQLSVASYCANDTYSPFQILSASDGRNIICGGPMYNLTFHDTLHRDNEGHYKSGEYLAKAYIQRVIQGNSYQPLRPLSASRNGAVIDVLFNVPVAPLVLDTTHISLQTNYGFSFIDDASSASVSSVALQSDGKTVRVTLNATPTGSNMKIRYGCGSVWYGNLRDSDYSASLRSNLLANWCCHFSLPIT